MSHGKAIHIYLPEGTTNGIITAELSNWNGYGIKIGRTEVPDCSRSQLQRPGVYFLICKGDGLTDQVYVGESENVKERLVQHQRDYQNEKEKFFWHTAVIFTSESLNKTLIRYLENRLADKIKLAGRHELLTKDTYKNNVIKEYEAASMDEFLENIEIIMGAMGYKILEPIDDNQKEEVSDPQYYLTVGDAQGVGKTTSDGFVVFKGATMNPYTGDSKDISSALNEKRKMFYSQIDQASGKTTEDCPLSSPSAAAEFLVGYAINGRTAWKTKDGRSLKEVEEAQSDTATKH